MPLGNSITQADNAHSSYRYPLWKMLTENGYKVDYVGSMSINFMGKNPVEDFDHDHEGHWGWRADQFVNGVDGIGSLNDFMSGYTPDIILMHIGSNDILQGEPVEQVINEIRDVIKILLRKNPDAVILVSKIIPVVNAHINKRIALLNNSIERLPAKMKLYPQVSVVDMSKNFNPFSDTYDGIHPNERGEQKMAETWYKAIVPILSK